MQLKKVKFEFCNLGWFDLNGHIDTTMKGQFSNFAQFDLNRHSESLRVYKFIWDKKAFSQQRLCAFPNTTANLCDNVN